MKNEKKRLMILGLIVALCMLMLAGPVMAVTVLPPLDKCPTNLGSCSAQDVQATVTQVDIKSPNNMCTAQGTIDLEITASFHANTNRYDFGAFVSQNGGPVNGGSACAGAAAPINPFVNRDGTTPPLDTCGDIDGGSTVIWTVGVTVDCNNIDANGNLVIPACLVWSEDKNAFCTDLGIAGTGSKCTCNPIIVTPTLNWCAVNGETCKDGNPCTDDSCDPLAVEHCGHTTKPDQTSCNDGDLCTTGDICSAGTCGGTGVTCSASDQCHLA